MTIDKLVITPVGVVTQAQIVSLQGNAEGTGVTLQTNLIREDAFYEVEYGTEPGVYACLQPPNYQTDALRGQLTAWDFSRYTPKAVIINIGTNDCNSGADAPTFQCSYRRLLELVREKNPAAPIFALIPFGGYFREEITQVVHRFGETQGNIYLVDTRGWLETPDYADGIHPTNEGQGKAAQKLCQVLSPILGPGTL